MGPPIKPKKKISRKKSRKSKRKISTMMAMGIKGLVKLKHDEQQADALKSNCCSIDEDDFMTRTANDLNSSVDV